MNEGESRRDKDKDVRLAGHDVSHSTLQVLKDVMTSAHLAFQKSEASIEGRLLIARARGAVPLGRDSGINIFPPPTSPPTLSPSPHKLPTPKVDKPAEIVSSSTFDVSSLFVVVNYLTRQRPRLSHSLRHALCLARLRVKTFLLTSLAGWGGGVCGWGKCGGKTRSHSPCQVFLGSC